MSLAGEDARVCSRVAWLSIVAFSLFWLARWPTFPLLLDPYYHLCAARQMVDAGGVIAYEWWEYAPVGRRHIYPPLLHVVLAGLLNMGCSPLLALRLVSAVLMPALLASLYAVMRRLTSPVVALASVWIAIVPFAWIIQVSGALASGLALVELLWFMVAMREQRDVAASCLLALLFYTHLGLPWVALASLLWWYGLKAIRHNGVLLRVIGLGALLAGPWLGHLAASARVLQVTGRYENETIEGLPLVYLLAAIGAWRCWKHSGTPRLLLGLWLGFCLMASSFAFRWLSGEGLLPVILLAGYGLGDLSHRLSRWRPCVISRGLALAALGGLLVMSPSFLLGPSGMECRWLDTAPFHLLNWSGVERKAMDVQLYNPYTEQLAKTVEGLSHPREIIWSNAAYVGGMVAALAHRPTSSAMFYEVPPARPFDPIAAAQWIVWFKIAPLPDTPALEGLVRRYQLTLVAEDEIALLFRNPAANRLANHPHAVIPWWLAVVLLCILLSVSVWDLQKPVKVTN